MSPEVRFTITIKCKGYIVAFDIFRSAKNTNFPETIHMEFTGSKRVLRRTSIVLLFAGVVLILVGAWMKITERPSADIVLATGVCAELFGIILSLVASSRTRSLSR